MEHGQLVVSGSIDELLLKAAGHRTLSIQVLNDPNRGVAILQQIPSVQNIFQQDPNHGNHYIEIEFCGDENARADLLENLIFEKIRVVTFNETITNLEEAFLRLTQGEVG